MSGRLHTSLAWVPPDTVVKFTAEVALTIDRKAKMPTAVVTETANKMPTTMTATCNREASVGELLAAVLASIQEKMGNQEGSVTAKEWSEEIEFLLEGCPYKDRYEQKIKQAFADGALVQMQRINLKEGDEGANHDRKKKLTGREKQLVLMVTRPAADGEAPKTVKNTAEWLEPKDAIVKLDSARANNAEKDPLDYDSAIASQFKMTSFVVHGHVKRPRKLPRACTVLACAVQ